VRGRASYALHEVYAIVHEGVRLGHRMIREGVEGMDVHRAIQALFERQGYRTRVKDGRMQGFFHGTGHGLGLQIHEAPSIGKRPCVLKAGHVVTVEPGLYYPGARRRAHRGRGPRDEDGVALPHPRPEAARDLRDPWPTAGDPLLASLRFAAFAALAVLGPGIGLQRLARLRWDPALVIPLGLLWCGGAWWLSLVARAPWLFPLAALVACLPLLRRGLAGPRGPWPLAPRGASRRSRARGPPGRDAVPGEPRGAGRELLLDVGEHVDTAVHVGVTWELVAGYPPQVPGLAGVPMRYHRGQPPPARRGRALGGDPPLRRAQPLRT